MRENLEEFPEFVDLAADLGSDACRYASSSGTISIARGRFRKGAGDSSTATSSCETSPKERTTSFTERSNEGRRVTCPSSSTGASSRAPRLWCMEKTHDHRARLRLSLDRFHDLVERLGQLLLLWELAGWRRHRVVARVRLEQPHDAEPSGVAFGRRRSHGLPVGNLQVRGGFPRVRTDVVGPRTGAR